MSEVRQFITDVLLDHEYVGNGMCKCGRAVGWSDGAAFEVHMEEHLADQAYRSLFDAGLLA